MGDKANSISLIHSEQYRGWVFDPIHPTQGRRFDNARDLLIELAKANEFQLIEDAPRPVTIQELERVHSTSYIEEVLLAHNSGEWVGQRPDLSKLASLFAGGTLVALDLLLGKKTELAIHFPGAKHHAQRDHSSGFCVFNDFALAAEIATKVHHKKVLIVDIDAHHGDGVENMLAENFNAVTFSVHQKGIFPGTGNRSKKGNLYNFPLRAGSSDKHLLRAIDSIIDIVGEQEFSGNWTPDLLFLTCGADGHEDDPLTSLNYSVEGYVKAARKLKARFPNLPILMGGAGGYLPDTRTPEIWAKVAIELAKAH